MSSRFARVGLLLALLMGLVAVPAVPAEAPTGQFQPTAGDRDGDGVADGSDCAPDDPSRPAQSGRDADCDGGVDQSDRSPTYSSDSSAPVAMATLRAAARRAARVAVVSVADVGPAAVFGPREPQPLLVFAAREPMRVTVTPILIYADGWRVKVAHSWSKVARGEAWAFRVRPSGAERVVAKIVVTDGAGGTWRATRTVYG